MAITPPSAAAVLINGKFSSCLDCADRGLQYGDGVFSTIRVLEHVPLFFGRHLERLRTDASRLGIPFPDRSRFTDEVFALCASHRFGVLKIILTRGVGGRGYRFPEPSEASRIISIHPSLNQPADIREKGVRARICDLRLGINPRLAGIKHLNRLEQVLARAEWSGEEIREGLMLDHEGFLVEGVMTNVFLATRGRLCTPLLDRCGVSGVMRGLVIDLARKSGLKLDEARILPREIEFADEMFLTNSVIGIWPVCALEDRVFPVGAFSRSLMAGVDALTEEELDRV